MEGQIRGHERRIEEFLESIGHKFESEMGVGVEGRDESRENVGEAGELVRRIGK